MRPSTNENLTDCMDNLVYVDSENLSFASNFDFIDSENSNEIITHIVCANSADAECFANFVFLDPANSNCFIKTEPENPEASLNLSSDTQLVRVLEPNTYSIDSRVCRKGNEANQETRMSNYILGRQRPLPEVEHVSDDRETTNDDDEVQASFSKYSLYARDPGEMAELFFSKASKSHMQKHFKRRKKNDTETPVKAPRPFVRRRKKPKNTYVTKAMKLSGVKFEPIPRAQLIDELLKS